ncbi:MAG: alanine--glyoxylate aminotransferase family protein [Elusimicrobiaceae bacterium]|nr:alanine--glyoxylate aminotransferase family protein [Elusimicrobiaceae bacterium]
MESLSFLPGPVRLHPDIFKDLATFPLSHRTEEFKQIFHDTCSRLSYLTKAKHTALLMGSGTLANEVIAAQLSTLKGKGLILSNGEFGDRLVEQASRFSLDFEHMSFAWGDGFNYPQVADYILQHKPSWVWFVHVETSTGILNDLPQLLQICKQTGTKVCVDCMSSIGNMPLDLSEVYLAAASSGKGLAGFNGIALVFSNHIPAVQRNLPKYLDLGYYYIKDKIPFTFSYNLLFALHEELKRMCLEERFNETARIAEEFAHLLGRCSVPVLGKKQDRVNFIFTLIFKNPNESTRFGNFCAQHHIAVHYKNDYLKTRNWIQIVFMGHHSLETSRSLFTTFLLWHNEKRGISNRSLEEFPQMVCCK